MNSELEPRRCGLYTPGHQVHVVQALRAGNDVETRRVRGHLLDVSSEGVLLVELEGGERRFWNHDPERLASLARGVQNRISVQWRWRVLRVPHADGAYLFCLADVEDQRPCPAQAPEGDLVGLLTTAGGWMVRGDDPRLRR